MATVNSPALDRILDGVRVNVPGAVDPEIARNYFQVMRDFFQYANCWTDKIPITVTPECRHYDATPSVGFPNRLMAVYTQTDEEIIDGTDPVSQIGRTENANIGASMTIPGVIELRYFPNVEQKMIVKLALTVSDPITKAGFPIVPDWILQKYGEGIEHGIISKLMLQVAKPYTNLQAGTYHRGMYQMARNQARTEANHENTYRGQRWRFPQSGNVMRR